MSKTALKWDNVTYYYCKNKKVVNGISISVDCGEFVVLFGPNGSGKTTLLKLAVGLLKAKGGKIELFGDDIKKIPNNILPQLVSYIPQVLKIGKDMPILVKDVIDIGYYSKNGWRNKDKIKRDEETYLSARKLNIEHLINKPIGEISGGEARKVQLARILSQRAQIMILDEPTAHLDIASKRDFYNELKALFSKYITTIILVVHSLEDIPEFSKRMIYLEKGRVTLDDIREEVIVKINLNSGIKY
ncbi:MAG: ABC transporter ATP-binding protein [bacterium]